MKLRRFEIRWANIIARTLLPPGLFGGVVDDVDLGEALRRQCLAPPWYTALLLRLSLWLAWFAPVLYRRRPSTLGGLDDAAREAVLDRLLQSGSYLVRSVTLYLKLEACLVLLGDERVLERIGAYEHGHGAWRGPPPGPPAEQPP